MTRGSPNRRAGALATFHQGWSRDPLKGWARKDTALADTESIDHAAVDVTRFDREFLQMLQSTQQPEVTGVIDHRLDPERTAALEVGLDSGMPEVGIEGDLISGAQQPGAVATHRWPPHPPPEDDLHLLRTTDIDVVSAQRLKEPAGMTRRVEHDRARDLNLAHRDVPPIARGTVGVGQRQRQPGPPALGRTPGSPPRSACHRYPAIQPDRRWWRTHCPAQ